MIRIVIVDKQPLLQIGLQAIFKKNARFTIIGQTDNLPEAQSICDRSHPEILLLDLSIIGPLFFSTIESFINHSPDMKILIIGLNFNETEVKELIKLGVSGFIDRNEDPGIIEQAICSVLAGDVWLSQRFMNDLFSETESLENALKNRLTRRELGILRLIIRGYTNQEISVELYISRGTVRNHIVHIYKKLGVHTRTNAVIKALKIGIEKIED